MNHFVKIGISPELWERLETARKKFKRRTVQAIVGEVAEDYLYLWEAAEEKRQRIVERQRKGVIKKLKDEELDSEPTPKKSPQES